MIELILGMIIGTIVLALIIGLMVSMMDSSDRSTARTKSQRQAVAAVELLTNDLRTALAPDRTPILTGSDQGLRTLLLGAGSNPEGLFVHDLLIATSNQLTFYGDVQGGTSNAGVECVTWRFSNGGVSRTVRRVGLTAPPLQRAPQRAAATAACNSGTVIQKTQVIEPPPSLPTGGIKDPFSYARLVQPNPNLTSDKLPPCTTTSNTPGTDWERSQVLGVNLDLRSFAQQRSARGNQQLRSAVAIPSRSNSTYHFAIGCVFS